MKTTKRIFALVVGVIVLVQLSPLPTLKGLPSLGEPLGSSIARKIFAAVGVYLVAYGLGFFPRSTKSKHNDSSSS